MPTQRCGATRPIREGALLGQRDCAAITMGACFPRQMNEQRQDVQVIVEDGMFRVVGAGDSGDKRVAVLSSLPQRPVAKAKSPRRILVIEDNLDSVHSLVLLLRDMGHVV